MSAHENILVQPCRANKHLDFQQIIDRARKQNGAHRGYLAGYIQLSWVGGVVFDITGRLLCAIPADPS